MGLAPDLPFKMPKALREDIAVLNDELERSSLYQNAPMTDVSAESTCGQRCRLPLSQHLRSSLNESRFLWTTDCRGTGVTQRCVAFARSDRTCLYTTRWTRSAYDCRQRRTIITGRPGSGKTTQIPQLILDDWTVRNRGADCNVPVQLKVAASRPFGQLSVSLPNGARRSAIRSIPDRFDLRLLNPTARSPSARRPRFYSGCSSALGIYVNEAAFKELDSVTHIIVDEVQDREIDVDLLLVVLKRFLADRRARDKPVKIVLLSTGQIQLCCSATLKMPKEGWRPPSRSLVRSSPFE